MSTFPLQNRTPASVSIIRPLLTQALSVSLLPLILLIGLMIALTGCSSSVESLSEVTVSATSVKNAGLLQSEQRLIKGVTHNTYGAGGVLEDEEIL